MEKHRSTLTTNSRESMRTARSPPPSSHNKVIDIPDEDDEPNAPNQRPRIRQRRMPRGFDQRSDDLSERREEGLNDRRDPNNDRRAGGWTQNPQKQTGGPTRRTLGYETGHGGKPLFRVSVCDPIMLEFLMRTRILIPIGLRGSAAVRTTELLCESCNFALIAPNDLKSMVDLNERRYFARRCVVRGSFITMANRAKVFSTLQNLRLPCHRVGLVIFPVIIAEIITNLVEEGLSEDEAVEMYESNSVAVETLDRREKARWSLLRENKIILRSQADVERFCTCIKTLSYITAERP